MTVDEAKLNEFLGMAIGDMGAAMSASAGRATTDKPRAKATDVVKRTMETSQNTRSCAGWF